MNPNPSSSPPDMEARLYDSMGVYADTGVPQSEAASVIAELARAETTDSDDKIAAHMREESTLPSLGVLGGFEPNFLNEVGWGVVFHENAPDSLKDSLEPLIEHRRRQVGNDRLFRVFENRDGYRTGDGCSEWLARHKVSLNPVDPRKGVPYYLLLVGSPEEIPFEFQYLLDIFWAVGRIHFDDLEAFRRYAESVVEFENDPARRRSRSLALFAPNHDFDRATQMFVTNVAKPLDAERYGIQRNFRLTPFIGEAGDKERLRRIFLGCGLDNLPSILFSGSHGAAFPQDSNRILETQGALVCRDWPGPGNPLKDADYFSAADIPDDADVHGLFHFMFACYGAACPQFDDFHRKAHPESKQIAPKSFISRLPQRLLGHPNGGALAVLGHVDRAWAHSFHSAKAGPQLQGFQDILGRLMLGHRIGHATDQFNVRWSALCSELTALQIAASRGKPIPDWKIADLWTARNDARNYIVFGDPAVQLKI